MLVGCQLLTVTTTLADYTHYGPSLTRFAASTLQFGEVGRVPEEKTNTMADRSRSRSRGRAEDDTELWFNMPSAGRHAPLEQSAYQATSSRLSMGSVTSTSSQIQLSIPTISTSPDINKSLPPPPTEEGRRTLRSFLRGRSSSSHLDPSHLQPGPHVHTQRHLSAGAHLSVDVHGHYQQQYSRSMPSSPYGQTHDPTPSYPPPLARVQSAHSAFSDTAYHEPYPAMQYSSQRESPLSGHFDASPTRSRTFPETTIASPTARISVSSRPRPYTWLSPTEPFADPSQFHLFVEATTGLPDDTDPWSPNGPNRLQSSLFARRSSNGSVPTPPQYVPAPIPDRTHQTASWQSFEPPLTSSRSVSAPVPSILRQDIFPPSNANLTPHMNAINAELEMLGLDGDRSPDDDELPDYAQSQAEMNARKREEAAARARDLEARWLGARARRR